MTPLLGICTDVKASGTVTVLIGSQVVTAQCPRDLTVAAGDTVTLHKAGSSYYVIQRYYTAGGGTTNPTTSPVPPSAPATRSGQNTFHPNSTRSWNDAFGWRTDNDDIYQGEYGGFGLHIGCAFYGTSVHSLHGATVTDAWIKARRLKGGDFAARTTTIGHITEGSKPSGMPTFGGGETGPSLAVGGTKTHINISNSLAQSLVDGTYHGLGIHISSSTPYVILGGLAEYGASFALTIKWTRSS